MIKDIKINKRVKGASDAQLEIVRPLRGGLIDTLENINAEELVFVQNELRRLSRELKRYQKRLEKEETK